VHQVGFSLHNYIEMQGQQNVKFKITNCMEQSPLGTNSSEASQEIPDT
jgi:hypothetical protein